MDIKFRRQDLLIMKRHIDDKHDGDTSKATPTCPECRDIFLVAEQRAKFK